METAAVHEIETSRDAFGRIVRTFWCEHGTMVKTEGLDSEPMWPVRIICPQGCDLEFVPEQR